MAHRPSSPRGSLRGGPGDAPDGDPPGDRSRGKGSRPRRARTRSPEEKRHRILAAAQELFRERGYGEVTAAEIAREAEVSEGIVFHHFGSKRGVLAAVSAAYGADLARAMFAGILPGGSPDVRDIIERVFEFVEANGNLHQLLVLVQDPADWNEALQSNRAVIIAALAAAFEEWARRGFIHTSRPREAAILCFGLVESGLTECFVRGDGTGAEALIDEAVRLIEGGLGVAGRGGGAGT